MAEHAETSRAALGILGTRVGVYPIKIIVTLVVAPLLGTTDYGIYTFLVLPGAVLLPLLLLGLGLGIRYYISSGECGANDMSFPALSLGLFHGAVTAVVTGLLWKFGLLGEAGRSISFAMLLPVLCVMPLQGAGLTMNRVMVGASWFSAMNIFIFLTNVLPPILLVGLVIIADLGLVGAIWTIFVSNAIIGIASIFMTFLRYRPSLKLPPQLIGKLYSYGLRAWVGSLANRATVRLDQFVLGFARAPAELGVYRIAVMVAELIWMIPDAVSLPLFNRISRTESGEERVSITARSHRLLLAVVTIVGIGLVAVSWKLLPWILGPEYADAGWLLALLIPGTVALVTSRILGTYFGATGKPQIASLVEIIGAVVSVAAYLLLIPTYGVAGAAIGTSISYIVLAVAATVIFQRNTAPHRSKLFVVRGVDLTWASGLVKDSLQIWRNAYRNRNKSD